MTITNGYITLDLFKRIVLPKAEANADDDGVIEFDITAASRDIDILTHRTFYARTETRYYDIPHGRSGDLYIHDDDLLTISTNGLTNGDGTVIAATNYQLLPLNSSPKYAIHLKEYSGITWLQSSTTGDKGAITVAGTWGYSSTADESIQKACAAITKAAYNSRHGINETEDPIVLPSGLVISAGGIPKSAWQILQRLERKV